jgi:hypothetical protein
LADNDLAPEVGRLIDAVIASMDHVEVLRLLAAAPDTAFTADALSATLRSDPRVVREALHDLVAAKLVAANGGAYTYAATLDDREAVAALIHAYNTRPVTLVRAIYARPKPIKAFADAFRIRRSD